MRADFWCLFGVLFGWFGFGGLGVLGCFVMVGFICCGFVLGL